MEVAVARELGVRVDLGRPTRIASFRRSTSASERRAAASRAAGTSSSSRASSSSSTVTYCAELRRLQADVERLGDVGDARNLDVAAAADALRRPDQVAGGERAERLAHRRAADAELGREQRLARESLAVRALAPDDLPESGSRDLLVGLLAPRIGAGAAAGSAPGRGGTSRSGPGRALGVRFRRHVASRGPASAPSRRGYSSPDVGRQSPSRA